MSAVQEEDIRRRIVEAVQEVNNIETNIRREVEAHLLARAAEPFNINADDCNASPSQHASSNRVRQAARAGNVEHPGVQGRDPRIQREPRHTLPPAGRLVRAVGLLERMLSSPELRNESSDVAEAVADVDRAADALWRRVDAMEQARRSARIERRRPE